VKKIITIFLILFPFRIFANIEEYTDASLYFKTNFSANEINLSLSFNDQKYFWINLDASLNNDEKYIYEPWQDVTMFGYYYLLKEGYIGVNLNKKTTITVGQIIPKDEIDSKYSLFFNNQTEIGKYSVNFDYEGEKFFYKSNWMLLNKDSALEYQDRGLNYKTYGITLGNFKIGLQDIIIYKDRVFDPYYFLNPFPSTMIQEIRYTYSAPWVQKEEIVDDNSMIGMFIEYNNEKSSYYLQLFIDDLNLNRIFNPESYQNPDKIAWSLGTKQATKYGIFGFYHAGATKYTNQRTESGKQTEYTYYPSSEYYYPKDNPETKILDYKENYLGYIYGENTVSFLIDYLNQSDKIDNYVSLEYAISGEKSPHEPWNGYKTYEPGTHLLNDDILEHFIELNWELTLKLTDNLKLTPNIIINHYTNKIEFVEVERYKEAKIWQPVEDNNETNFQIGIKFEVDLF